MDNYFFSISISETLFCLNKYTSLINKIELTITLISFAEIRLYLNAHTFVPYKSSQFNLPHLLSPLLPLLPLLPSTLWRSLTEIQPSIQTDRNVHSTVFTSLPIEKLNPSFKMLFKRIKKFDAQNVAFDSLLKIKNFNYWPKLRCMTLSFMLQLKLIIKRYR